MADIYGYTRNPTPDAVFSSENATLTFSGSDAAGLLIQSWNMQYQQQVQEVFEVGSSKLYWVAGRPVGNGQVARAIGAAKLVTNLISGASAGGAGFNMCSGTVDMTINASTGICKGSPTTKVNINMNGCLVTSVGYSMDVQDMRVMESFAWRFASLTLS